MSRFFVGVDIQPDGLYLATLQRNRPNNRLVGLRFESLEGVMEISSRQPNIRDARRFIEGLRRGVKTLAGEEERISLSLPDRCGRVFLTDVDAPFKSHAEGVDILKWQLKGNLPAAPAQVQLDYQVIERRDDGRQRCIAAAISKVVLEQFEDLVQEADRHAIHIDFHSLNLYNYYRPRLDLGEEFILVGLEKGLLGIQYILGRGLSYYRSRDIKVTPEKAFREMTRTLVEAYKAFPAMRRCAVFAHVDPGLEGDMQDLISVAFDREVRCLDPALKRFSGEARTGGLQPTGSVVAALGAAERLM